MRSYDAAMTDAASLLTQAEAARAAGDLAGVRSGLVAAFRAARSVDDVESMTAAALGLTTVQGFGEHPGQGPAYLHETLLATHDLAVRARLLCGLARAWSYGGEFARAGDFADDALALAADLDDPRLTADALDAALLARWNPDEFAERVSLAARLEDVALHLDDPEARLTAILWRLTTAWECLDVVAIARQIRALERLEEETGSPRIAFYARSRRAAHTIVAGDLDIANAQVADVFEIGEHLAEADVLGVTHTLLAELLRRQGDAAGLLQEGELFEEYGRSEGVASVIAQSAVLWLEGGDPERAGLVLDSLPEPDTWPVDVDLLLMGSCVQYVAAATGRDDLAERARAVLEPYAGRAVVNAGAVAFHGVVDEFIGRRGEALAAYRRLGATWWVDHLGATPAAPEPRELVVHLEPSDAGWTVGRAGATFALPDLRGLHHLRTLLQHPGTDVPALDLVGAETVQSDLGPVLDDTAKRAYRARLADLDAEIDEADAWSDPARSERANHERQALLDELSAAVGLAGRDRRPGATAERARMAVRKAVTAALRRVEAQDPPVARLLRDGIRTGVVCRYEPDPGRAVRWVL